ncbi:sugar ABC transporter permease [Brachybacterium sp. GPGPB12]|uniref:carbohydrate ABC transporter permease n=1 Tax=Brachybacterium sp. GPGPB12 TaxID=3023517 RepID=UPI00313427D3
MLVSLLAGTRARALLDREFVGRGFIRTLLITPFLIMPVAGAMLWSISMFDPTYGLVNWLIGTVGISPVDWTSQFPMLSIIIALVWQWTPFMMSLLLAGLQSQTGDVLEAAQMDGAGTWTTFVHITLPHLRFYLELSVLAGRDLRGQHLRPDLPHDRGRARHGVREPAVLHLPARLPRLRHRAVRRDGRGHGHRHDHHRDLRAAPDLHEHQLQGAVMTATLHRRTARNEREERES